MLTNLQIENLLFLDIETVPVYRSHTEMPAEMQGHWENKMKYLQQRDQKTAEELYEKAGIYSEFAKIICISTGFIHQMAGGQMGFRVKSFCGKDEKVLLQEFANLLESRFNGSQHFLCGHNSREFDLPFIARRMLINGVKLPAILNIAGKKPWEVKHLDTMELWKFGDYKHYTSLALLAALFEIPTPKDDISGADVAKVFYEHDDLERIKIYCEKDTLTVAQLMLRFNNLPLILSENVISV